MAIQFIEPETILLQIEIGTEEFNNVRNEILEMMMHYNFEYRTGLKESPFFFILGYLLKEMLVSTEDLNRLLDCKQESK